MNGPPLEALRLVEEALVFKGSALAGRLARVDQGVEFRYEPGYLQQQGRPVATSLPLTEAPVLAVGGAVPPFFAGLLPEGRRLGNLRRAIKTSADDELSLLLAVGHDTVGDVVVVPVHETPCEVQPLVRIDKDWSEVRFRDVLAESGVVDPVGLPGVQEKASAAMRSVPVTDGGAVDSILKLDPPEHPHLVANEAFFAAKARSIGMPAVETRVVHDADGRPGLLVQRFDRIQRDGDAAPRRLAVEDACQVMGRWPADKYNVTSEACIAALADVCASRMLARRDLYRQLVFAWLTGNGDAHAKNLAVLATPDGELRVAPAFDLPSTLVYGDTTLALSIGGRRRDLSRKRWYEFAETIGLPTKAATRVIDTCLAGLAVMIEEIQGGVLPFAQKPTADLVAALRNRRRLMVA